MEINIKDVDFGRLDAESDAKLATYFVDTGVTERIASGEKQYVIGRKGSGKTALFKEAKIHGAEIVRVDFDDYAWEVHKAIKEMGLPAENAYTASWIFTFLVAACRVWRKSPKQNVRDAANRIHLKIYGADEGGALDMLLDRAKRMRKLELPNAGKLGGLGAIEFEAMTPGEKLAQTANAWNTHLYDLADSVFAAHPISVFVDRLDDGWDASNEMMALLAGAMKAARALNLRYRDKFPAPAVVLFLRSDIFSYIKFNDKNKIGADIEYVTWDSKSLIAIARERISKSIPVKPEAAWEAVFSDKRMRQRTTIPNYILKRTMQRPRDLVAFCLACRDAAIQANHNIVETEDVYVAEEAYSRHIYNELVDELHKQVPGIEDYFQALNIVGYSRFTVAQWNAAVAHVCPECVDPRDWLKTLYKYAVIGVPKVGGKGGGSKVEFVYEAKFPNPNFAGDVVVHPALIKQLQLKNGSANDDTPVEFDDEEG